VRRAIARIFKVLLTCVGTPVITPNNRQQQSSLAFLRSLQTDSVSVQVPISGESTALFNTSVPGVTPAASASAFYTVVTQTASQSGFSAGSNSLGQLIAAANSTAFAGLSVSGFALTVLTPNPTAAPTASPTFLPTLQPVVAPHPADSPSSSSSSSSPTIVIAVGAACGALALAVLCFAGYRYHRKAQAAKKRLRQVAGEDRTAEAAHWGGVVAKVAPFPGDKQGEGVEVGASASAGADADADADAESFLAIPVVTSIKAQHSQRSERVHPLPLSGDGSSPRGGAR